MIQSLVEIVSSVSKSSGLNYLFVLSLVLLFLLAELASRAFKLSRSNVKKSPKVSKLVKKTEKAKLPLSVPEKKLEIDQKREIKASKETNKKKLPEDFKENLGAKDIFFPLLSTANNSIPRFKEINQLRRIIKEYKLALICGESGVGKSYLASSYSKESRFLENRGVLSFRFNFSSNSLEELARFILINQLEKEPFEIEEKNLLDLFWSTLRENSLLLVLGNVELLSLEELKLFFTKDLGKSNVILLTNQQFETEKISEDFSLARLEKNRFLILKELKPVQVKSFLSENSKAYLALSEQQKDKLANLTGGDFFTLSLFGSLVKQRTAQEINFDFFSLFQEISTNCLCKKDCFDFLLKKLIYGLNLLEKECLFSLVNLKIEYFSVDLIKEIINSSVLEIQTSLESLFDFGLIQKISQNTKNRNGFVYSLHPKIKELVFEEFNFDKQDCFLVNKRATEFYLKNIEQSNNIGTSFNIFEIENLIKSLKLINSENFKDPNFFVLFQKCLKYIQSAGFYQEGEKILLSSFEDNLLDSKQLTRHEYIFWTKIIAICKLVFSESKISYEKELNYLNEAIFLFQKALNLISIENQAEEKLKELTYFSLGQAFLKRFDLQNSSQDLRKAIENLRIPLQTSGGNLPVDFYLIIADAYFKAASLKNKDSDQNIRTALKILIKAKEFYQESKQSRESKYVLYQITENLAKAYRLASNLGTPENKIQALQRAIENYQESLNLSHSLTNTNKISLLNNIGCCFWNLSKQASPQDNIEKAIFYYKNCLAELGNNKTLRKSKLKKTVLYSNLGTSYKALASFEEVEKNLAFSAAYFQEAYKTAENSENQVLKENIETNLNKLETVFEKLIKLWDSSSKAKLLDSFQTKLKNQDSEQLNRL